MFTGDWTLRLNVHRTLDPPAKYSPEIGPFGKIFSGAWTKCKIISLFTKSLTIIRAPQSWFTPTFLHFLLVWVVLLLHIHEVSEDVISARTPVIVILIRLWFSLISQGELFGMYVKMCHYTFLSICSQFFIPNISLAQYRVCCVTEKLLKMNCLSRQCNKDYGIPVCDFVQLGRYVPMLSSKLIFSAYWWWSHAPHYRVSYSVIPHFIHSPSWDSPVAKQNHVLLKILKETVYPPATLVLTLRLLMSYIYIYGAPILDVSRSHTTTHHSR